MSLVYESKGEDERAKSRGSLGAEVAGFFCAMRSRGDPRDRERRREGLFLEFLLLRGHSDAGVGGAYRLPVSFHPRAISIPCWHVHL